MATRLVRIAMDARDDAAVGRFWAQALGWGVSSEAPGVTNLEPEGVADPEGVLTPALTCSAVAVVLLHEGVPRRQLRLVELVLLDGLLVQGELPL
ncbi:VOC family protein [Dactylosporangium sp. CA-152071]|uniref:VOC family protein n=1 Tax=Dactylosporangium sp. CA-152071 TaxID=3239933 RepID=UPI003D930D03